MSTRFYALSLIFSFALFASLHADAQGPKRTVQLGTLHYPPFIFCDENNRATDGLDIRILKRIFLDADLDLEIRCMPWRRLLHLVATGKIDGAFPLFDVEERQKWGHYLDTPLHYESLVLATLSTKPLNITKSQDLDSKTLGIVSGFYISDEFDQHQKEDIFKLMEFQRTELGLKSLARGRIDAYVGNITVIGHTATTMGIGDELDLGPRRITLPTPTHLVMSKKSQLPTHTIEKISLIARRLHSNKTLKQINDQYLDIELNLDDRYCPQHVEAETIDW